MNQNFHLFSTLLVLLEERNISLAAQKLCLSQPAVSKRLKQLRETFHDQLLIRIQGKMELTALAQSLYPQLKKLCDQCNALLHASDFAPEHDPLTVELGLDGFGSLRTMPFVLAGLNALCPRLTVKTHHWQRINATELALGKVHCAKCYLTAGEWPPDFHAHLLSPSTSVCLLRKNHPLAEQEWTLASFLSGRHISYLYEKNATNRLDIYLERQGIKRDIAMYYPSLYGCLQLVSQSDLILSTPLHNIDSITKAFSLTARPIPIDLPVISEYFLWHTGYDHDPGHQWFRKTFLKLWQDFSVQASEIMA